MSLDDGLGSNHVLVSLHIKKPSGIKTKRSASKELAERKKANDRRVKVTVETFKDGLAELEGHRQMTRSEFDRRSLNWGDDGKRLWHVPEWDKFRPKMEEYKAENYAHYKKFLRGYEEIKNDAQRPAPYGLGDLYDEADWKSVEWLESRWMFEWDICPVPRPESDVRSGWGPRHVQRMRKEFEEQMSSAGWKAYSPATQNWTSTTERQRGGLPTASPTTPGSWRIFFPASTSTTIPRSRRSAPGLPGSCAPSERRPFGIPRTFA